MEGNELDGDWVSERLKRLRESLEAERKKPEPVITNGKPEKPKQKKRKGNKKRSVPPKTLEEVEEMQGRNAQAAKKAMVKNSRRKPRAKHQKQEQKLAERARREREDIAIDQPGEGNKRGDDLRWSQGRADAYDEDMRTELRGGDMAFGGGRKKSHEWNREEALKWEKERKELAEKSNPPQEV